MVFFNVTGAIPGLNLEVDIQSGADKPEHFLVLSGTKATLPSPLPARVSPGQPTVSVQRGHFELKLSTVSTPDLPSPLAVELYDAAALSKSMPTTFICSSCSLPLVQSKRVNGYKDLPSEHWQELIDVWICHSDQKLHNEVMENAKHGFWPKEGEALVGGSYIVFEESGVIEVHIRQLEAREVSLVSHCTPECSGCKEGQRRGITHPRPDTSRAPPTIGSVETLVGFGGFRGFMWTLPC